MFLGTGGEDSGGCETRLMSHQRQCHHQYIIIRQERSLTPPFFNPCSDSSFQVYLKKIWLREMNCQLLVE